MLVSKFNLDYERHPLQSMKYFLNTNRCIIGDVQRVRSLLDKRKPVRGAEVFAVTPDCKSVLYNAKYKWYPYRSATEIRCHFQTSIKNQSSEARKDGGTGSPLQKDGD